MIYKERVFEFSSDKINKALTIEKLTEIPLKLGNKGERLFLKRNDGPISTVRTMLYTHFF
jgi:phosphatidate phosphatase PAH1